MEELNHNAKVWLHANKVCHHTILSTLSNDLFDVYCSYKEVKSILDLIITKDIDEDVEKHKFMIENY